MDQRRISLEWKKHKEEDTKKRAQLQQSNFINKSIIQHNKKKKKNPKINFQDINLDNSMATSTDRNRKNSILDNRNSIEYKHNKLLDTGLNTSVLDIVNPSSDMYNSKIEQKEKQKIQQKSRSPSNDCSMNTEVVKHFKKNKNRFSID